MAKERVFPSLMEKVQSNLTVVDRQSLQQFERNVATILNITGSLRRCVDLAKRDPTKTISGLTRAFQAARKRIKEI